MAKIRTDVLLQQVQAILLVPGPDQAFRIIEQVLSMLTPVVLENLSHTGMRTLLCLAQEEGVVDSVQAHRLEIVQEVCRLFECEEAKAADSLRRAVVHYVQLKRVFEDLQGIPSQLEKSVEAEEGRDVPAGVLLELAGLLRSLLHQAEQLA